MYHEIESEFQIAARKRAVGDQICPACAPAGEHPLQGANFYVVLRPRTPSMLSRSSPCPLHLSRVTSHRILIETPRLEFPATLTKQRLRSTSNRDTMALFSPGPAYSSTKAAAAHACQVSNRKYGIRIPPKHRKINQVQISNRK